MVIKDFRCPKCGTEVESLAKQSQTTLAVNCQSCNTTQVYFSVCNGGAKQKHPNQWDQESKWDSVKFCGMQGENRRGNEKFPLSDSAGNSPLKKINKKIEERRDRFRHKKRKQRGGEKLFF